MKLRAVIAFVLVAVGMWRELALASMDRAVRALQY
jgi:hypothetical protein